MPHDIQESLVGGATVAVVGQKKPAALPPDNQLFNAVELRLFRYTAVLFSLVTLTTLIGIIAWSFGWMLSAFYNLLLSLSLAGILALVLYPVVEFLESRIHLPRLLAIILLLVIFVVGIGGLFFLIVPILVNQTVQLMTVMPDMLASWQARFSSHFPEISSMISNRMESIGGEASQPVLEDPGTTIISYLGLLAGISFVPLFLFFALLSGDMLRGKASELISIFHEKTQKKILYFMDVFVGYITAFFQGQLIIAVSMGALYAMSFTLIGLKFGVLVGMVLGLLNIVPFLGTLGGIIGMVLAIPLTAFFVAIWSEIKAGLKHSLSSRATSS